MLTYGPNGTSRGIASIIFGKPDTAAKAAKELNGLLVDGKPMKVRTAIYCLYLVITNNCRLRLLLTPRVLLLFPNRNLLPSALRNQPSRSRSPRRDPSRPAPVAVVAVLLAVAAVVPTGLRRNQRRILTLRWMTTLSRTRAAEHRRKGTLR